MPSGAAFLASETWWVCTINPNKERFEHTTKPTRNDLW